MRLADSYTSLCELRVAYDGIEAEHIFYAHMCINNRLVKTLDR